MSNVSNVHTIIGYAWHYKSFNDSQELAAYEQAAREAKVGIWSGVGDQASTPPWEWRKEH